MGNRVYNFCPGPASLPEEVLKQAQAELLDFNGSGMSVMEISHRSKAYMQVAEQAERDLRKILSVPDDYKVLFLQGGANLQFAQVPLNLLSENGVADYVDTGIWSRKAIAEAKRYGHVNVVASSQSEHYDHIPPQTSWALSAKADYVHIVHNETIGGLEFQETPKVDAPLVADMSSNLLSRPINVSDYGLIYAGAQKNIGPSGLIVVIIHESLLGKARTLCPTMMNYQVQAENDSMYNTPPTFSWYLAGLVFQWIIKQGGLIAMSERNHAKQKLLYDFIDQSDCYYNPINKGYRSWMNVPFRLKDDRLDGAFLKLAEEYGLCNLKGHRSVGGMRASIYNAIGLDAVQALVRFMADFEKKHAG